MEQSDRNLYQYAVKLAHRYIITDGHYIITDGHVDLPYRLKVKNVWRVWYSVNEVAAR